MCDFTPSAAVASSSSPCEASSSSLVRSASSFSPPEKLAGGLVIAEATTSVPLLPRRFLAVEVPGLDGDVLAEPEEGTDGAVAGTLRGILDLLSGLLDIFTAEFFRSSSQTSSSYRDLKEVSSAAVPVSRMKKATVPSMARKATSEVNMKAGKGRTMPDTKTPFSTTAVTIFFLILILFIYLHIVFRNIRLKISQIG